MDKTEDDGNFDTSDVAAPNRITEIKVIISLIESYSFMPIKSKKRLTFQAKYSEWLFSLMNIQCYNVH